MECFISEFEFYGCSPYKNEKDGKTQVGNVFAEEEEKLADTEIEIKWYFWNY